MVHGRSAAATAVHAAEVLFGGDPSAASAEVLAVVAAEVPDVALPADIAGMRVHELLVGAGLAKSNSEVNRLLGQRAVRAGTGSSMKTASWRHQTCSAAASCCSARASATTSSEKFRPEVDAPRVAWIA